MDSARVGGTEERRRGGSSAGKEDAMRSDSLEDKGWENQDTVSDEAQEREVKLSKMSGDARGDYERILDTTDYKFTEAFQDSMLGLKVLQDAIAAESRKAVKNIAER